MNKQKITTITNWLFWLLVIASGVLVITSLSIYYLYSPTYCDAAYYIEIARQINKGYSLYSDIHCTYTPIGIYLVAFLEKIFHCPKPFYIFCIDYFIIAVSILLVYAIARELKLNKKLSIISAAVYSVTYILMEVDSIFILEPISNLFGLAAILATLKAGDNKINIILAGLVASISFWCKQYGAGFFPLCAIILVFDSKTFKDGVIKILLFVSGYAITFLLCYLFWEECLFYTTHTSYGTNNAAKIWYETNERPLRWAVDLLLNKFSPFLYGLVLIPFVIKSLNKKAVRDILMLACGIVGYMSAFYLSQSYHYFIYVIPFTSLLMTYLWSLYHDNKYVFAVYSLVAIATIVSVFHFACINNLRDKYKNDIIYNKTRQKELAIAKRIKTLIPEDACVYNATTEAVWLNLMADLTPSTYNGKLDFSFGPLVFDSTRMKERVETAEYAIYMTNAYDGDWKGLIKKYMPDNEALIAFRYTNTKTIVLVRRKTED
ncbi:MAG: DUF2079 domain-containing protein [Paludibacteraceae bacterium]|nr:DUF2079 domain-containing protein [Paludibacteraceae bacterium]